MHRVVIVNDNGEVIADIKDDEVKVKRGYVAYVLDKPKDRHHKDLDSLKQ